MDNLNQFREAVDRASQAWEAVHRDAAATHNQATQDIRASIAKLCVGISRIEGGLAVIAGNNERLIALVAQCRRLRRLMESWTVCNDLSFLASPEARRQLEIISKAIKTFSVPNGDNYSSNQT